MILIDTRNGQRVHNTLTGQTGTVIGLDPSDGQYLVDLDVRTPLGDKAWWVSSHMATLGHLDELAGYCPNANAVEHEILDTLFWASILGWDEESADLLERLTTLKEYEFEGGRVEANEGVLRSVVRMRLTPQRWVAIPGLGRSVPVYA
jgi:uncharacterized protein YfaP (DUF2135 family)